MVTLNKPSAGDTNWTSPINDNWTTIEGSLSQAICQGRLTLSSGNPLYNPLPKTPSSTSTGSDTVDFSSAHGWTTGTMVFLYTASGGLAAGTIYYINAVDLDTVSFHTTLAAAEAGTSKVDLTASVTVAIQPIGVSRTSLYFAPFRGNRIAAYDGSTWKIYTFTECSLSISGLTASKNHDIFIYDNAGTLTLEAVAWTNDTTRATLLVSQDGVYVKSGAPTRRYLGTIRTTTTTGQCEDSLTKRFVANYYNRVGKTLYTCPGYNNDNAFTSYTCSSITFVAVNLGNGAMVEWVCIGEDHAILDAFMTFSNGGANNCYVGIEIDSANNIPVASVDQPAGNNNKGLIACTYAATPTGVYRYAKLMFARAAGTLTAFADGPRTTLNTIVDPALTYLTGQVIV